MQAPVPAPGAPPFIRLLSRFAGVPARAPARPPAGQLGEWIGWPQAVALSRALEASPDASAACAAGAGDDLAGECARLRADLADAIDSGPGPPAAAGITAFEQHARAMQRAMQTATGHLRGELRERLAAGTPQQARLAAVDAALEAALGPREHALLAPLYAALGGYCERLRQAAPGAGPAPAPPPGPPPGDEPPAWMQAFRRELRDLLLAELDLRFQPIEGLLAALRSP